jgi:hypothetical protein
MTTKIKYGEKMIERENTDDIQALFSNEKFEKMILRQLKIMREHCKQYPLMDKDRKVTITLKLKPEIDKDAIANGEISYSKAVFVASVGSPSLPETSIEFKCAVGSDGIPYYNREDPKNPFQLTFRDFEDNNDNVDNQYIDPVNGKAAAIKG